MMLVEEFFSVESMKLFALFSPGPLELAIIGGIVLLLFGSSKLPTLMRNLGRSTNEFKRGMNDSAFDDEESASKSADASE